MTFLREALAVTRDAALDAMRDYFKPLRYWQFWVVVAIVTAAAQAIDQFSGG